MGLITLAFLAFIALLAIGPIAVLVVVGLFDHWQQVRRQDREHELKRELGAKGILAEEIERIIRATAVKPAPEVPQAAEIRRPTGAGADRARLVALLCEHGMEAGDVKRVLRAVGDYPDDELSAKVAAIASMLENSMGAEDIERVLRAFQRAPGMLDLPPDKGQTAFRE